MHMPERSRFLERITATGGYWPEQFVITAIVDTTGVPFGTAANPIFTTAAGGSTDVVIHNTAGTQSIEPTADHSALAATPAIMPIGGEYRLAADTYNDGDAVVAHFNAKGEMMVAIDSDIEIGAVELKDGATDNRAIINDANTVRNATDHVLLVQTIDALGNVVGASAGMPFISTHYAPNDFTATRTNDTTVAITVGPVVMTTTNTLVAYITKKSATNVVTTYINGTGGVSLYISANDTLTLIGGTVGATDTIQSVGVRIFDKENTITTNSKRTEIINGLNTLRTGPQTIGAQQTFTTAYVDWGGEIAVTNYNKLMLFIDKTFDGADSGLKLQILGKHTGAAADEYVLETDIALGDATGYIAISRPALLNNCVEYIQLQIKADGDASPLSTVNAGSKYELAW